MNSLMTVDLAHCSLTGADPEALLDESLKKIRHSENLHVLKVIHGSEREGRGGGLKSLVTNWVRKNRKKIISSIDGAELSSTNPHVQVLLAECGFSGQKDFDAPDKGVTIVWVT